MSRAETVCPTFVERNPEHLKDLHRQEPVDTSITDMPSATTKSKGKRREQQVQAKPVLPLGKQLAHTGS
jgi:hypothetical protein